MPKMGRNATKDFNACKGDELLLSMLQAVSNLSTVPQVFLHRFLLCSQVYI